jgi:hypothetical protein
MKLALFDLDRTLLPIDGADDGSHFVVRAGGGVGGDRRRRAAACARSRTAPARAGASRSLRLPGIRNVGELVNALPLTDAAVPRRKYGGSRSEGSPTACGKPGSR